ncbi:energy transducer TonB [Methyloradius palustris]|uniref:TonB C-terminal domain-containing protein n=1 Tax=Methyloradius palustris TaxID=2778876 RepID=A0A8D5G9M0_9PROT|nr:energy transducer TonB [Methyloradius palustris]BCM25657.1 hypothetical protein ZMTM_19160 [Methyloradius palustris]
MSYRRAQYVEPDRRLPAFGIALSMHIAVLLLWSHLDHVPVKPPILFEIELTQVAAKSEASSISPPEPIPTKQEPQISKAKPVPVKTAQVKPSQPLMAKEMPAHEQDFVVPSNSSQSQQPSITTDSPAASPAEAKADVSETSVTSANKSQSTHSEEADPTEAWNGYGQMLYEWISKNKNYPELAIRRHWEGRAKVIARFDQGKLISVSIMESGSGHQVLDDAALETLRKAANALPVKGKLENKSFTVVIPLNFKLEG